jgi:hypothetical protein
MYRPRGYKNMKTLRNPARWGGLGVANQEKAKPLGVECHHCRSEEVHYSMTVFHKDGCPEIYCPGCKRKGYMIRGAREGGRLVWFREAYT